MQSDRLGRILKIRSLQHLIPPPDHICSLANDIHLSFDEAGNALSKMNQYLELNDIEIDNQYSNIFSIPDHVFIQYVYRCLGIKDVISVELTCKTLAISCRAPSACSHIAISQIIEQKWTDCIEVQSYKKDVDTYRFSQCKSWNLSFPKTTSSALLFQSIAKQLNGKELDTLTISRYDDVHGRSCDKPYFSVFRDHFPHLKSVIRLNIKNYHMERQFVFLDFIISRSPKLKELQLENIRIDALSSLLNLELLSFRYCRISEAVIEAILQYQQVFWRLKTLRYEQHIDLIHHYDARFVWYILRGANDTLESLFISINLFSYGNGYLSDLSLPRLRELTLALTPKLRADVVIWSYVEMFNAPNLKSLCLIFNPCHRFDIDFVLKHFGVSVKNVMIISTLYDHEDVLRFVDRIQCLVVACKLLESCWINVKDWPMNDVNELEVMLSTLTEIQSVTVRLENKIENKIKMNAKKEWIVFEDDQKDGCCKIQKICKSKGERNDDWMFFEKQILFNLDI